MKRILCYRHFCVWGWLIAAACLPFELAGATFQYSPFDLVAGFRKSGGTFELEVNVGSVSNYLALAPGQIIRLSQVSAAQFTNAFDTLSDLQWSVSSAVAGVAESGAYPAQTLWLTRERKDPAVSADPWDRRTASAQSQTVGKVRSVGINARNYAASGVQPEDPLFNTATVLVIGAGQHDSYGLFVGASGNWGNFPGSVEGVTAADFRGALVARLDLFEIRPTTTPFPPPPSTALGYFELRPDASLWFRRAGGEPPGPIPPPTVLGVVRAAGKTSVSVTTTNDATVRYTLRFTSAAGLALPVAAWPKVANSLPGTGGTVTIEDVTDEPDRCYTVEASR